MQISKIIINIIKVKTVYEQQDVTLQPSSIVRGDNC